MRLVGQTLDRLIVLVEHLAHRLTRCDVGSFAHWIHSEAKLFSQRRIHIGDTAVIFHRASDLVRLLYRQLRFIFQLKAPEKAAALHWTHLKNKTVR